MACAVESEVESLLLYVYRLCDQRIACQQVCLGELATLEKCCNVIVHVIHTTIVILWPFRLGREAEVSLF